MAEEPDYEDILEKNVGDAREAIEEIENPDFRKLLQLEREGKDRKTVKEFLEPKVEEQQEQNVDETVEEIEKETEGGLLGDFNRKQTAVGGIMAGVLIGLIAGFGLSSGNPGTNPAEVESSVTDLFEASGIQESDIEIVGNERRNEMHYLSINLTSRQGNQTRQSMQNFYVSPDGEMLFRVRGSLGQRMALDIQDTINQLEQRQRASPANQTGNTTQ